MKTHRKKAQVPASQQPAPAAESTEGDLDPRLKQLLEQPGGTRVLEILAYASRVAPAARAAACRWGIPASYLIAEAVIVSGGGRGDLVSVAHWRQPPREIALEPAAYFDIFGAYFSECCPESLQSEKEFSLALQRHFHPSRSDHAAVFHKILHAFKHAFNLAAFDAPEERDSDGLPLKGPWIVYMPAGDDYRPFEEHRRGMVQSMRKKGGGLLPQEIHGRMRPPALAAKVAAPAGTELEKSERQRALETHFAAMSDEELQNFARGAEVFPAITQRVLAEEMGRRKLTGRAELANQIPIRTRKTRTGRRRVVRRFEP